MRIGRALQVRDAGLGGQERAARVDLMHQIVALHVGGLGPVSWIAEALLTQMSMPPNAATVLLDRVVDVGLVAHVDDQRQRLAAGLLDLLGGGVDGAGQVLVRLGGLGGDGDVGAVAGGAQRDRQADAAAAPVTNRVLLERVESMGVSPLEARRGARDFHILIAIRMASTPTLLLVRSCAPKVTGFRTTVAERVEMVSSVVECAESRAFRRHALCKPGCGLASGAVHVVRPPRFREFARARHPARARAGRDDGDLQPAIRLDVVRQTVPTATGGALPAIQVTFSLLIVLQTCAFAVPGLADRSLRARVSDRAWAALTGLGWVRRRSAA